MGSNEIADHEAHLKLVETLFSALREGRLLPTDLLEEWTRIVSSHTEKEFLIPVSAGWVDVEEGTFTEIGQPMIPSQLRRHVDGSPFVTWRPDLMTLKGGSVVRRVGERIGELKDAGRTLVGAAVGRWLNETFRRPDQLTELALPRPFCEPRYISRICRQRVSAVGRRP
ncbi:MAG: hypothetical protein ABIJ46_03565 [bacterium]